jgi:DNA uptake protein ComE-like DNA-binding protein
MNVGVSPPKHQKSRLEEYLEWKRKKTGVNMIPHENLASESAENQSFQISKTQTGNQENIPLVLETKTSITQRISTSLPQKSLNIEQVLEQLKLPLQEGSSLEQIELYAKMQRLLIQNQPSKTLLEENRNHDSDLERLKAQTKEKILYLLNTGSVKELRRLKLIGEKRAESIINAREEIGEYKNVSFLLLSLVKLFLLISSFLAG